jgi:pilus assembly protein CpaF
MSLREPTIELRLIGPHGELSVRTCDARRPIWIGRDPHCDLVLQSGIVSRRHLAIDLSDGQLRLCDASSNGVVVNGQPLLRGSVLVGRSARVEISNCTLEVQLLDAEESAMLPIGPLPSPSPSIAQRRHIHRALLDHLDLDQLDQARGDAQLLRPKVIAALERVLDRMDAELPAGLDRAALIQELVDEALGLGPLERLLADDAVSEIMVVDAATIFVERNGCVERAPCRFTDDDAVRAVIERIVTPLGRRIDESMPLVDARLPDGSRVNAVIPPLAVKGAAITIRRFCRTALNMEDLIARGALSSAMAKLLQRVVIARRNILIAGGTGSGKTTLLNVMATSIGRHERVVTIEDAAELRLGQAHVVSLEARPANLEGKGAFTIRDLVRNALRMRPDRIVVGECRGGEALDMLQAMNTGHEGSMTTIHANSPKEAVARLETLCLMAGVELPLSAIRAQIASSVHVVVQQARFVDGSRRVTAISEVLGLDDDGQVRVCDVFRFRHRGMDRSQRVCGAFGATGFIPTFMDDLIRLGLAAPGDYL